MYDTFHFSLLHYHGVPKGREARPVHLTIIGSASAEPNPGSASSCYLLDAGQGQLLLECGHGAVAKLLLYTSPERVRAIVISHMHPDHFFDLVPLKYLILFNGLKRPTLYVPPTGPGILAGIAQALGENGHFWEKAFDIQVFDPERGFDASGMSFRMAPTHHFIPAWSMRIRDEKSGSVLAYTSDTSLTEKLVEHLQGPDLLLAEASIEHQDRTETEKGHLTGEDAGLLASQTQAKRLVVTHYPQRRSQAILKAACAAFQGPCDLALEGAQYTI